MTIISIYINFLYTDSRQFYEGTRQVLHDVNITETVTTKYIYMY